MAIPFTIPNQEVSQPNIQELLRELCEILQQLLIICRQYPATNANQQTTRNRASASPTVASQDRIPELMTNLSLLSAAFNIRNELTPTRNLRQRARRHRTTSEYSSCEDAKNNTSSAITTATTATSVDDTSNQQWIEVGMELRKIADDFKSADYKDDESEEEADSSPKSSSKASSTKRNSIFSKFVPAPFTGSICTAVICVVGWHLLRNR